MSTEANTRSQQSDSGDDLRSIGPPTELFHYTTAAGVLGILTECALFATHAKFSNDATEIEDGLDHIASTLRSMAQEIDQVAPELRPAIARYASVANDLPGQLDEVAVYMFCLSEARDQLSQWRAYGERGAGYCIGFLAEGLMEWPMDIGLMQVIYRDHEKRSGVEVGFGLAADQLNSLMPSGDLLTKVTNGFLAAAVSYKNPAFEEEVEWRLVARSGQAQCRVRSNIVVPYLPLKPPEGDQLPVSRIIVGPQRYEDVARRGIEQLRKQLGYNFPIELSAIPFRDM